MKKFQDWVNENVGEDMVQNKNMPDNKETLSSFVSGKKPKIGDKAYSMYHGIEGTGILWSTHPGESRHFHLIILDKDGFPTKENPWFGNKQQLMVGYDEPIVWDAKRGMFYAPADRD